MHCFVTFQDVSVLVIYKTTLISLPKTVKKNRSEGVVEERWRFKMPSKDDSSSYFELVKKVLQDNFKMIH